MSDTVRYIVQAQHADGFWVTANDARFRFKPTHDNRADGLDALDVAREAWGPEISLRLVEQTTVTREITR